MGKHRSGHSYQEFPILNVARRCGLVLNDRTLEWEEVEASCPFCGDHGPGKHHLFLNTTRNIFRCVLCGEKGNSVSLYAKMEGVSNRQAFRALSEDSVLYRFPQQPLSQKPAEREPSSLAVRHNVYYDMLMHLELSPKHKADLLARGLSEERIEQNMYRTLPMSSSARRFLAGILSDFHNLEGVPGFYVDRGYGIVSLFGIILAFVVQFLGFNGSAKEKMHHYQTAQEDMNNASVEYVRGMPEIKAFNQTADSFRRLSKSITDYTSFVLEYAMGWQNCMPGFTTIIHNIYLLLIPVGIFIGMGAEDYRTYSLTFIFYLVLAPAISGVLNKIMYISESFTQIDGNVERMEEVLSIPVLQNQDVGAREQGHSIEFDHVSFSYDTGTSVKALNDVSFIARQGEVTAIVGPSGGGKSTIANLISRFWDVTEGCIRIGGVDIRKIPQAELMRQVSFVFQDTFLFKQSILDNIRMGNPTASEAQVIEAAKAAQCHDFIEKLPDGYHTMIGASGIRLSGGERQRIAIARAIIKDAPIIVLDEATAFSDPENEYLIQKAFEKLIQNKTVIMIAHRLSTIRNADQILVMEHGQLIEQGTHDTLMERQGKYTQMWNSYMESISWKIRAGKGGAIE